MNKDSNSLKEFSSFSFLRTNRPNFYLKTNLWQHCKSLSITSLAKFENVTKLFRLPGCQPVIIYNSFYVYYLLLLFSIISPWSTTTRCPEQHFDYTVCLIAKYWVFFPNLIRFPWKVSAKFRFTSISVWNVIFANKMNEMFPLKSFFLKALLDGCLWLYSRSFRNS